MKQLDFVCPICGGRLLVCWFETGSTDYLVSKTGKPHKNPIRRASTNLDPIEERLVCCENVYNRTCKFATDCDLEFDYSPEYARRFKMVQIDDRYKLYELEE